MARRGRRAVYLLLQNMSGSRHLRVRLQTSASPAQVFAVMRGLTSARPESLRSFSPLGAPTVSTHSPRFTIRAPGGRGDAPVAWAGLERRAFARATGEMR